MKTLFEQKNQDFSNRAHDAAEAQIYPFLFPEPRQRNGRMTFERASVGMGGVARLLDGEMATDWIVRVHGFNYLAPFCFAVQERFRDPSYIDKYGEELTVTTWNNASNQPSELYKLYAGVFVYGYYNAKRNSFESWIAVHSCALLLGLLNDSFHGLREQTNKKGQDFLAIPFDSLASVPGVVVSRFTAQQAAA